MVLHGCGAWEMYYVRYWTEVAAANDIVMVFPEADYCWDTGFTTDP